MKFKLFVIVAAVLLMAIPSFAADVDGKWSGTFMSPGGDVQIGFNFKADGAKLTGTTTGPDGMEVAIADGKIDGKNITFNVTIDFGGMPFTIGYKGVVEGEEIKLTLDFAGMPFDFTVKKAK